MFDLAGKIKKKSGFDDMFGDAIAVPQSVQDALQIKKVFSDGIFWLGKETLTTLFQANRIRKMIFSNTVRS